MKQLLIMALLLVFGCADPSVTPEPSSNAETMNAQSYITPDTFKTCTLDSCPEQPILSLLLVEPNSTLYTPVKVPIDDVFVTCLASDDSVVPEGAIRVTFEDTSGVTRRTYDPRFYDWVPVVPNMAFVGLTNIGSVEVECSVTYAVNQ